mmetsp:Transcript_1014/g.1339  ORF Transcript_1014/g.1339 Transcript_1014/m.1339 type:complete len:121 (+) Transcript_1014:906-1268(+)
MLIGQVFSKVGKAGVDSIRLHQITSHHIIGRIKIEKDNSEHKNQMRKKLLGESTRQHKDLFLSWDPKFAKLSRSRSCSDIRCHQVAVSANGTGVACKEMLRPRKAQFRVGKKASDDVGMV